MLAMLSLSTGVYKTIISWLYILDNVYYSDALVATLSECIIFGEYCYYVWHSGYGV